MAKVLPQLILGGLAGLGAFLGLQGLFSGDAHLKQEISALKESIAEKEMQLDFLRQRQRVAHIEVLEQEQDPSRAGGQYTRFRFQEIGPDGQPFDEGDWYEIDGDILYVDALVIKFDDQFVEQHDLIR
ncbi:MAG: hypothetical protein ACPG31_13150, partial [Planctomycetota bacterium]